MNLPLISFVKVDYPGYFPDFGILPRLVYIYTEKDLSNAHAMWDGLCLVFIPLFILCLVLVGRKLLIKWKRKQVLHFIQRFSVGDPFWDEIKMKETAVSMFQQVQYAWMRNEFRSIAPWISDRLKMEWQHTWLTLRQLNYAFLAGKIDITRVTIIAVEDHLNTYQHKFKVEISGYIKRYFKDGNTNLLVHKNTMELQAFTDIYTFVRGDDQWLLDGVHYSANFGHIMLAKNFQSLQLTQQ
jgi:hypothetical protein